ncbi:uncharacterized protein LOC130751036 [Actinidia eriantha]|uniref:uncharacterized protein LOC130751036 n=1 Tax=Actinidia eriantha TaxID=165200 RepID=UPI002590AF42|nr:uncharacterized protein LOC130751036 [Actinidia eriantha]
MESKFHGLPPLKRFRLMHQEQEDQENHNNGLSSSCLPAKKRKQSRDFPALVPESGFCLPAKKRVWALQPDLVQNKPISPFDLNVKYNPQFDEEGIDLQKEKEVPIASERNQIAEKEDERDNQQAAEDNDDDGIECAVCRSTDGDPSDPIVFCDGCDLMVHQTCYGSPLTEGVPEGDWFCAQCLASQTQLPHIGTNMPFSCCLCPVSGGAVKLTTDGRWAHIVCSLFVPEVFFAYPESREGIDCSRVPDWRWEQSCYVCESVSGCVIDCSEPKCELGFHVTCGLKEDLCIEYREGRKKGAVVAGFCKNHTELWKKQQQTGKFKIVARDEHKN